MSGFRVLGILTGRKLTNTEVQGEKNSDYLKVLNENTYYPLSQSVSYSDSKEFVFHSNLSPDIFSLEKDINGVKNNLSIEVSAIVGMNGTGKSTLFDLIYLASYNLGCYFEELEYFEQMGDSIKYEKDKKLEIGSYVKYSKRLLFFSILYKVNQTIFLLEFNGHDISLKEAKSVKNGLIINFGRDILKHSNAKGDFEKYFYSIAINYSIYGLNSNHTGPWIKSLFHKNDGYRVPMVINPMRNEGNFDINDELSFSNDRVLSNVISEQIDKPQNHKIMLTEKQYVKEIKFTLKEKYKKSKKTDEDFSVRYTKRVDFIIALQDVFFARNGMDSLIKEENENPFIEEVYNYLKNKYDKIISTYSEYADIKNSTLDERARIKTVFTKISKDNSHVTYKFKQCINFLLINSKVKKNSVWKDTRDAKNTPYEKVLSVYELIEWSGIDKSKNISEFLPPSIFKKEVVLGIIDEDEGLDITIGDLSSGEQQLINSIQTVTYHLNNLQSVHYSGDNNKIMYEHVNIMFDEIELYFHPDYQRRFIKDLIRAIQRLELGNEIGIKSINIIFATHSPFILSDIPSSNVLRLTLDDDNHSISSLNKSETFGANIHDLLKSKFFLEEGFIGEFAKSWIEDLIKFLKRDEMNKYVEKYRWDSDRAKLVIGTIGEPILKMKLSEMYDVKFKSNYELDLLRQRIRDIEENKK